MEQDTGRKTFQFKKFPCVTLESQGKTNPRSCSVNSIDVWNWLGSLGEGKKAVSYAPS